ncbi:hypothetical protein GIB67_002693 [Kingdonia uniflora]|uniref:Uncharacterized protein n=1 Tax=Kingdonia uniflora TaxID=39325 RepID=A0A7J7LJU0_9MAGN|nr:hypothetical protein GIB67_002693 [Kingdonia uniflora]
MPSTGVTTGDKPLVHVPNNEDMDEGKAFGSTDEETPVVESIATSKPKRNMDVENLYKANYQKKGSGEIEIFDARWYFSGKPQATGFNGAGVSLNIRREERQACGGRTTSVLSVDMHMRNETLEQSYQTEKIIKEKMYKQPSSPGAKFVSFLNSFFNQAASVKRKKSKSSSLSVHKDKDIKSVYSSSSTGVTTFPPTDAYKDLRSYSDQKTVNTTSKGKDHQVRPILLEDEKKIRDFSWLEDKFKVTVGFQQKNKVFDTTDRFQSDEIWPKKEDYEEGQESDSSSDLFELNNYDLGAVSTGLPTNKITNIGKDYPLVSNCHF